MLYEYISNNYMHNTIFYFHLNQVCKSFDSFPNIKPPISCTSFDLMLLINIFGTSRNYQESSKMFFAFLHRLRKIHPVVPAGLQYLIYGYIIILLIVSIFAIITLFLQIMDMDFNVTFYFPFLQKMNELRLAHTGYKTTYKYISIPQEMYLIIYLVIKIKRKSSFIIFICTAVHRSPEGMIVHPVFSIRC